MRHDTQCAVLFPHLFRTIVWIIASLTVLCAIPTKASSQNQFIRQLNAHNILNLTHRNMDLLEMYGTLIVPLQPQFYWLGSEQHATWALNGYRINTKHIFGIPLTASNNISGFNTTLTPTYQVIVLTPKKLKQVMLQASKKGQLKMQHYRELRFTSPAYLFIRVDPSL